MYDGITTLYEIKMSTTSFIKKKMDITNVYFHKTEIISILSVAEW